VYLFPFKSAGHMRTFSSPIRQNFPPLDRLSALARFKPLLSRCVLCPFSPCLFKKGDPLSKAQIFPPPSSPRRDLPHIIPSSLFWPLLPIMGIYASNRLSHPPSSVPFSVLFLKADAGSEVIVQRPRSFRPSRQDCLFSPRSPSDLFLSAPPSCLSLRVCSQYEQACWCYIVPFNRPGSSFPPLPCAFFALFSTELRFLSQGP